MRDTGKLSVEFILLVALLNAMVAMSIDTMLPALPEIGDAIGIPTDIFTPIFAAARTMARRVAA